MENLTLNVSKVKKIHSRNHIGIIALLIFTNPENRHG